MTKLTLFLKTNFYVLLLSDMKENGPEVYTFLRAKVIMKMFASLLLWLKLLYYLRTNKDLGYLIRMITEVLRDITAFMIVFIIFLIAFSNAIVSVQEI